MSECPKEISCECGVNDNLDYSLQNYPAYTNSELTFFIPCPEGFSCAVPGVQIIIPAGRITYRPTTASGNNQAAADDFFEQEGQQQAENEAMPQLQPIPFAAYNATIIVSCQPGQVSVQGAHPFFTAPGVITIPGGVFSAATVSQANALAIAYGTQLLEAQANCHWVNDEVVLSCPGSSLGGPIVVPAGTFTSTVSKDDANSQALTYAEQQVASTCYYENSEVILECPDAGLGGPITVPAGTYQSFVSQEDADAQAQAFAESQVGTTCYWENTEQTAVCPEGETGGPFVVPAGTYQSFVSQADANAQAQADADAQAAAGCSSCTDYPVSGLSWTVNAFPGASGSASGGSGSGEVANNTVSFEANLPNSCNSYDITISLPYTIRAPGLAFPPGNFRFIQIYIDNNLEDEIQLPYPPAGCDSAAGTLTVIHTIADDAYSLLNGYHNIYIYAGQSIAGMPDTPSCKTEFTFSITPLTPP